MQQKILIVGGVAGGATAAARLRRLNEENEIILFEKDEYISFANCGLPYYIGGEITDKSALLLQTPKAFRKRFNVDVRTQNEVVSIDRNARSVTVKNHQTGETYTESYGTLILSSGAEPLLPAGYESDKIFTLRNVPDTYRIKDFIDRNKPKTAVVVGGGYIGLEVAENLHRQGIAVTIVQRGSHVLAPLDDETASDVHRHIVSKGVDLRLNSEVAAVTEKDAQLAVELKTAVEQFLLTADMMILAVGVTPNTKLAGEAGLELNSRGAIVVSETMLTSDPNIYAVGDAVEIVNFVTGQKGYIPLAGPANKQARIAADNICGFESQYSGTQGSAILRVFDMTVAATGLNETAAKKAGLDYEKVYLWQPSHAGYYPGAVSMSIKVLFDKKDGKIFGAQITGYGGVDKRCDIIATAIRAGMTGSDLAKLELCYAPPYSSAKDPVNMAGFIIENVITGKVKMFHWHDVPDLQKRTDITLLDVRTPLEYGNGYIDGFNNIPLDDLRRRINEIDKSKPVYLTCQVGQRGYLAARILMNNGFDVFNLSGGYRLWNSIKGSSSGRQTASKKETNASTAAPSTLPAALTIDACGLQCPGPIMKLSAALKDIKDGDELEIKASDPAFGNDIEGFCRRTNCELLETKTEKGIFTAKLRKGTAQERGINTAQFPAIHGKNFIVFSGDLDKALAAFIMANTSAALGRKTSIFFTFWGLNILRKPGKVNVKKTFIERMFGWMMPKGTKHLPLSKMNMLGFGPDIIRWVMKSKKVDSLESLIQSAIEQGVELIACSMSMDVMGIKQEELIDGVKLGGAAAMLAHAEESDMSLFI